MVSGMNHSLGSLQYPPVQQNDAGPQRTKRSTDTTGMQRNAVESEGMTADDRRRNKGGGLDSLGRGNVL